MISQAALIGALVGLAFAAVEFVLFGVILSRARGRGEATPGMRALDLARYVQLVLFPLIGFILGPIVLGNLGD